MALSEIGVVLMLCVASVLSAGDWDYDLGGDQGPLDWEKNYPKCGGQRQSPINIDTTMSLYDKALTNLWLDGYDTDSSTDFVIINNGHSVAINLDANHVVKMSGGNLPGVYRLVGFHFHWGSDDFQGSEHTINGNKYPVELHLVHMNEKYNDLSAAVNNADGLAVLGVMIEIGAVENAKYKNLIEKFEDVKNLGDESTLAAFPIEDLLPSDVDSYYRYQGSLTTPACHEAVTWTVLQDKVYLSREQIGKFRHLYADKLDGNNTSTRHHIEDNYRPTQNLYGRTVTTSIFEEVIYGTAAHLSAGITVLIAFFLSLIAKW